jgi:hypothetical protein
MKLYTFEVFIKSCDGEYDFQKVARTSKKEITKERNRTIKKMKSQYKNYDSNNGFNSLADDFDWEREDNILKVYEIKTFDIPINKQGILRAWKIGYLNME